MVGTTSRKEENTFHSPINESMKINKLNTFDFTRFLAPIFTDKGRHSVKWMAKNKP